MTPIDHTSIATLNGSLYKETNFNSNTL
jgi:hypothetical protein